MKARDAPIGKEPISYEGTGCLSTKSCTKAWDAYQPKVDIL